jgi:hypothetical protein
MDTQEVVLLSTPDRRQNVGGGRDQAAKNAKVLMQAITESSLVLSRHSVFLARTTLKEKILHPKLYIARSHPDQASAASESPKIIAKPWPISESVKFPRQLPVIP